MGCEKRQSLYCCQTTFLEAWLREPTLSCRARAFAGSCPTMSYSAGTEIHGCCLRQNSRSTRHRHHIASWTQLHIQHNLSNLRDWTHSQPGYNFFGSATRSSSGRTPAASVRAVIKRKRRSMPLGPSGRHHPLERMCQTRCDENAFHS